MAIRENQTGQACNTAEGQRGLVERVRTRGRSRFDRRRSRTGRPFYKDTPLTFEFIELGGCLVTGAVGLGASVFGALRLRKRTRELLRD